MYLYIFSLFYPMLNCSCHLYGSIRHQMHNWAPFNLVESKMYVDMENVFAFKFCFCDLFVKNEHAPCYVRPIQGKGALALEQFQLARSFHILCIFVILNSARIFKLLDAVVHSLPSQSCMWKDRVSWNCSKASSFLTNRSQRQN